MAVCIVWAVFSDETESVVTMVSGSEQDYDYFPHQGQIPTDDPRYIEFENKFPPGSFDFCS